MDKLIHYADIINQVMTEYATDYDIVGVLEEEHGISKEDIVWLFMCRIKGRIRGMGWREGK